MFLPAYNKLMKINFSMNLIVKKGDLRKVFFSFLIPLLVILFRPLDFTMNQSIIFGSLCMILLWWSSNWVRQEAASIVLVVIFLFFGETPLPEIFYFPLSDSFMMVACSYLISQGIVNSGAAHYFSGKILHRFCTNARQLALLSFLLCTILIFFIPHPFPRVILLSSIYLIFLQDQPIDGECKSILLFSITSAATVTSLMFISGDIMANYAAMGFGNISISYLSWIKYMTLPTVATVILAALTFISVFRKALKIDFDASENTCALSRHGKKAVLIMSLITLLWLSEEWNGISSTLVMLIGTALMFFVKLLSLKDLTAINWKVLLFLTAQFSIGKVLIQNGIAEIIRDTLAGFFPDSSKILLIAFVVFLIMLLHIVLGSIITTLSISIPMLIILTQGTFAPEFIVLLACVCTYYHVLLPFHQVTVVIGFANGYFRTQHVLRLGIFLTFLTIASTFLLYIPWWKLTGLL